MAYQPKSYRKFLAGTITAAVVASAVAPAASAAEVKFTDLTSITDAETLSAIQALVGLGVIVGYPDGTFKPNQTINKSQAAEMIVKALPNVEPKANPTGGVFEDLTEKSYSSKFVEALVDAGLIEKGGKFGPTTGMTREAMAVTLVKAFGLKDTGAAVTIKDLDKASEAGRAAITILAQHGLTKVDTFNPTADVTRSQFALFFYRAVALATAVEVVEVKSTSNTTLEVKVKGSLTKVAPTDFTFDGGLTVTAAEIVPAAAADTFTTVKLTTSAQEAGKSYKLLTSFGKEVKTEVKVVGTADVVVSSVSALTNTKVTVKFKDAVAAAPSKESFTIKDDAGVVVPVTAVALAADGKSVVLTTAAQKAYSKYTIETKGFTGAFVGLPADTVKPTVQTVAVDSYKTVKITFSEAVDTATATNIANYTIDNNLSVLKAEVSAAGNVVTLTTADQVVGTVYKVTVQNVTDLAGNAIDKADGVFGGMVKDTTAQTVDVANTFNTDYNEIKVTFGKEVDAATATNIANYSINNGLSVLKAVVDADDAKVVYLTTTDQVVGTVYELTVSKNVTDTLGNKLANDVKDLFGGMAKDTSKPTPTALVTDNDKVTVTFNKKVDAATATNIANYTLDNSLTVVKAELNTAGTVVTLTTSSQTVGSLYKLTVQNVTSVYGTAMDKYETVFGGMAKDTAAPTITTISALANTVIITFSDAVDTATASNPTNYSFDGGLGFPTKAVVDTTLDTTGKTVVLTTAAQTPGKVYNVTVSNVADKAGNAIVTANNASKRSFVGQGTTAAAAALKFQTATVVNNNTIDLIFDRELTATEAGLVTATIAGTTGLTQYAELQSNKRIVRVQYQNAASGNPTLFTAGNVYNVTVTGPTSLEAPATANNNNVKAFAGTNVANALPLVQNVVAIDSTTLKVTFTEPVKGIQAGALTLNGGLTIAGYSVEATDVVTETLIYLNTATTQGSVYKLTPTAVISDAAGFNALQTVSGTTTLEYQFAGTNVANAAPTVQSVVALDKNNVEVTFSEAVRSADVDAATFALNVKGTTTAVTTASKELSADGTKLVIRLANPTALAAGTVYTLSTTSSIKDLAGVAMVIPTTGPVSKDFAGTNVVNAAPTVAGVSINSTRKVLTVTFSEKLANTNPLAAANFTITATGYVAAAGDTYVLGADGKTVTITLVNELAANQIASVAAAATIVDLNNQAASTTAYQFGIQ
jgi:trimeric autotransporter adhesin